MTVLINAPGCRIGKGTVSDKNQNLNEYYIYNRLGINVLVEYHLDAKANGKPVPAGEKGDLNEYYYGNGRLLAMKEFDRPGNGRRDPMKDLSFYHQDALGSVMMLTGKNGQVVVSYQYDAFGEVYDGKFGENSNPDNPFGFTGKRYGPEIGVYSFTFRDYDPRTMRWMTEDPVKRQKIKNPSERKGLAGLGECGVKSGVLRFCSAVPVLAVHLGQ